MATTLFALYLSSAFTRTGPSPVEGLPTYDIKPSDALSSARVSYFAANMTDPGPWVPRIGNTNTTADPPMSMLSWRFENETTISSDFQVLYSLVGDPTYNVMGRAEVFKFSPRNNALTLVGDVPMTMTTSTGTQTANVTPLQATTFVRGDRIWVRVTLSPVNATMDTCTGTCAPPTLRWGGIAVNAKFSLVFAETFTLLPNATVLYARRTAVHTVGGNFFDLLPTRGSSASTTGVRATSAGATELQWTRTSGGTILEWISPRFKYDFMFDSMDGTVANVAQANTSGSQSATSVNSSVRFKIFRRSKLGAETLLLTFNGGAESPTSQSASSPFMSPASYATTACYADDRLIMRAYAINVGTMANGTATLGYDSNALIGNTTVTLYNIEQFKAEADPDTPDTIPDGMSMGGIGN